MGENSLRRTRKPDGQRKWCGTSNSGRGCKNEAVNRARVTNGVLMREIGAEGMSE